MGLHELEIAKAAGVHCFASSNGASCEVHSAFGTQRVTAGGKEILVELKRKEPTEQISIKQP